MSVADAAHAVHSAFDHDSVPCVFCGIDGPLSGEHVFPQWCQQYLRDPEGVPGTHRSTTIRFGQDPSHRAYAGHPATHRVRSVCRQCNSGWMSRLEMAARPLITRMLDGRATSLGRTEQEVVSTWLVKTALVGGSKFNPGLDPEFFVRFHSDKKVGASTRVWLSAAAHREQHYLDFRPLRVEADERPPPLIPNAFCALIAVGHFAGLVVSWLDLKPALRRLLDRFQTFLIPIWPSTRSSAVWPPFAGHLDFGGLDALADGLVSMGDVADARGRPNF